MLTQMNHPHVLRVLGFCVKPAEDHLDNQERRFIVTEFAPNGSLENVIESAAKIQKIIQESGAAGLVQMPFTKIQALEWALQVASGMAYLHRKEYVHRDMKPQNVLLNESNRALVADLGTVRRPFSGEMPNREISQKEKENNLREFCEKIDIDEFLEITTTTKTLQLMTSMVGTPLYMAPEQFQTRGKCFFSFLLF